MDIIVKKIEGVWSYINHYNPISVPNIVDGSYMYIIGVFSSGVHGSVAKATLLLPGAYEPPEGRRRRVQLRKAFKFKCRST